MSGITRSPARVFDRRITRLWLVAGNRRSDPHDRSTSLYFMYSRFRPDSPPSAAFFACKLLRTHVAAEKCGVCPYELDLAVREGSGLRVVLQLVLGFAKLSWLDARDRIGRSRRDVRDRLRPHHPICCSVELRFGSSY